MRYLKRIWILVLAAASLVGCGGRDDRMTLHPVRGKVYVDGKPAVGMDVVLHPETPFPDPKADPPRGLIKDDGGFEITTYEEGDGAPAGRYRVTIFDGGGTTPERLRTKSSKGGIGRYGDPARSGLTLVVDPANETAPTFELSSKGPSTTRPAADSAKLKRK